MFVTMADRPSIPGHELLLFFARITRMFAADIVIIPPGNYEIYPSETHPVCDEEAVAN